MNTETMEGMVREALPGCRVQVVDLTGAGESFRVEVIAPQFEGRSLVQQHQLINGIFKASMADGSIHALSIKTAPPQGDRTPRADRTSPSMTGERQE